MKIFFLLKYIVKGLRSDDYLVNALATAGIITFVMSFFTLRITGWHSVGVFIIIYNFLVRGLADEGEAWSDYQAFLLKITNFAFWYSSFQGNPKKYSVLHYELTPSPLSSEERGYKKGESCKVVFTDSYILKHRWHTLK